MGYNNMMKCVVGALREKKQRNPLFLKSLAFERLCVQRSGERRWLQTLNGIVLAGMEFKWAAWFMTSSICLPIRILFGLEGMFDWGSCAYPGLISQRDGDREGCIGPNLDFFFFF